MNRNKKFIIWLILEILLLAIIFWIGYELWGEAKSDPELPYDFNDLFIGYAYPTFIPDIQTLGTLVEEDIDECWSDYDCRMTIEDESNWNHLDKNGDVIRGKAGEWGIAQFKLGTWNLFNEERRFEAEKRGEEYVYLDILDREDQLTMIVWAFNKGYQCHWTGYRKLYPGVCKP